MKRLLSLEELEVKGRRCVVVDPQDQQVNFSLDWLLHGVSDEDVLAAFAAFGKVVEVSRERWRVPGMTEMYSTTRTALLMLKSSLEVEGLPHQIRVDGKLALVVVLGRLIRFGHIEADCVRTCASATGPAKSEAVVENVMEVAETEEAAQGAGSRVVLAATEGSASAEAYKGGGGVEPQYLTAPAITPSATEPEQDAKEVVTVKADEAAATQDVSFSGYGGRAQYPVVIRSPSLGRT
ncbi:hypothetical protein HPB50_008009 [Hyalomma asiaticum]|uniref:Uncharacterized protein n=1 Tax=Hyalomma asiaticum TaxID=266040 RepID=A0ACB7TG99_HYAAI|nr:hypothetical protein HPB50_008009 [Hyalomma asiaticum]